MGLLDWEFGRPVASGPRFPFVATRPPADLLEAFVTGFFFLGFFFFLSCSFLVCDGIVVFSLREIEEGTDITREGRG